MWRGLDLACSLKQAPSRTYSEHDAYESSKREIEHARIEQSLKSITHIHLFLNSETDDQSRTASRPAIAMRNIVHLQPCFVRYLAGRDLPGRPAWRRAQYHLDLHCYTIATGIEINRGVGRHHGNDLREISRAHEG